MKGGGRGRIILVASRPLNVYLEALEVLIQLRL
jgi:hypothetical protein